MVQIEEIKTIKRSQSNNRDKNKQVMVSIKPNKQKKQSNQQQFYQRGSENALTKAFYNSLMYPDIVGPVRIPRSGASARTGLASDRTRVTVTPASTAAVAGFVYMGHYNNISGGVGISLSAATVTTDLTSGTTTAPGAQFPSGSQVTDVNMVSGCLVLNYFGTPLNAQGEIIVGTIPQGVNPGSAWSGRTYSGLSFYPGTIRIPVASLVDQPVRISMKKVSPIADNFVGPDQTIEDFEHPFFIMTGAPNTVSISVDIFRNFEYRSSTSSSFIIPYEKASDSFHQDIAAYEDALASVSENTQSISEGYTSYIRQLGESFAGRVPGIVSNLAPHALGWLQNRAIDAMRVPRQRNRIDEL